MKDNLGNDIDFGFEEFSDIEIDIDIEFETRYIKPPKTKDIEEHRLFYSYAEKLSKEIVISKDNRYFVIVNGSFVFGDFIEALITGNDYHVKTMTISTLSLNENNVDSLANLLNGDYVDQLNLIVSAYFYAHERHNLTPYIYQELDKNNKFQFAAASTHCKTCIIETHCGKFIVIHGSCNLRSSSNIEQFVIEESKSLYDFNYEYQQRIIEKYKTINKEIRANKIWKAIN